MRMARLTVAALALLTLLPPSPSVGQSAMSSPDTVVISSGNLRLKGLLWKPEGVPAFLGERPAR